MIHFGGSHLLFGLLLTLLVGVGRHWDDPSAPAFLRFGLGSPTLAITLSIFLWVVIAPLRPRHWRLVTLMTCVTFTAPPALLYAFPVEMLFEEPWSNAYNAAALITVSVWRVALFTFFLHRLAQFDLVSLLVAVMLPLTSIVALITFLRLFSEAMRQMGGFREEIPASEGIELVGALNSVSLAALGLLFVVYLVMVVLRQDRVSSANSARPDC